MNGAPTPKSTATHAATLPSRRKIAVAATSILAPLFALELALLHQPNTLRWWTHDATTYWLALVGSLVASTTLTGVALLTLRTGLRSLRRTRGRARFITLGFGAIGLALGHGILSALLLVGERHAVQTGTALTFDADEALLALPTGLAAVRAAATLVSVCGGIASVVGALLSWFLLSPAFRLRLWLVFDALLLVAFAWASLSFPIAPGTGATPEQVLSAGLRLSLTALFAVRLLVRAIAPALDLLERPGFLWLVASRLIRSRKSNFLTAIGGLSILAVAFSSCMLTSVLSFMGGFRQDLKEKILGNHAHVLVHRERGTFDDWTATLARARAVAGVTAASPYVSGEVMISSASTADGAILYGIDTATIGKVVRLPRDITIGKLELLDRPEEIAHEASKAAKSDRAIDLPAKRSNKPSQQPSSKEPAAGASAEQARSSTPDPTGTPPAKGDSLLDDLDRFIDKTAEPAPVNVLPGLIVGQELARTLRIYQGDEIEVVSPRGRLGPTGPIPKVRRFRVAGLFYTGMYEYDMKHVYAALPVAQQFLNVGEGITGIQIRTDSVEAAPSVAAVLRSHITRTDLKIEDWQARNQQLFGALALEKLAMFIVLGIALVVAGFCVFGTFTLMVQEKRREVGILKAMGARSRAIVAVFMAQGLLIGALGAGIGLGLGFLTAFASERFGIRINPEVYYIDRLPVHVDPTEFASVAIVAIAICLVAAIVPAYVASRLAPVDALRYD